ncbi:MAG: methyltransferase type 11 [Deltaproteobacteria bacterium]|nr:MAG: methyltransferase type 11 [Deltaproteobacteria bacterium]
MRICVVLDEATDDCVRFDLMVGIARSTPGIPLMTARTAKQEATVRDQDDDAQPATSTYLRYLEETDALREQTNLDILAALDLPTGSSGLDVGCGVGTQALMLAAAIGPQGRVTGLDIQPEFLERARAVTTAKGMSDRVTFEEGDFSDRLPFDDGAFDWVWSSDCLGYLPPSEEVMRVIRPGGSLNVLFWSSEQLLPGNPLLESRLKATSGGLAPFGLQSKPDTHPLRALTGVREAGLIDTKVLTFVTSVYAPLSPEIRRAMTDILEMRWPDVEPELSQEDVELYRRLTDPASPEFILNLPDYYGFYTYSVFRGWVPT